MCSIVQRRHCLPLLWGPLMSSGPLFGGFPLSQTTEQSLVRNLLKVARGRGWMPVSTPTMLYNHMSAVWSLGWTPNWDSPDDRQEWFHNMSSIMHTPELPPCSICSRLRGTNEWAYINMLNTTLPLTDCRTYWTESPTING